MSATPPTDFQLLDADAQAMERAQAASLLSRAFLGAIALAAFVALLAAAVLWQKVDGMKEQLARQSADALAQSAEARALARQASETVRDAAARVALNETRLAELDVQRAQVEDLVQSLSFSRDENLLVEMESTLRLALQQAQLTGNTEPLLSALRSAEQRVTRAAQPRLAPVQRAMQRDADRIRSGASSDNAQALQRIDQLVRAVDGLPTLNAVGEGAGASVLQPEALPADAPWWRRVAWAVRKEARSLVRVGRVEHPEAVLITPDQTYFLRENLKLKLLSVRLTLLSRQVEAARDELAVIGVTLNRYFDPASRRTQAAATLLQQLQMQVKATEPPRIDETLSALGKIK